MKHASVRLAAGLAAFWSLSCSRAVEFSTAPPGTPPATNSAAALFGDRVVAKGKGVEVTQSQVEDAYIAFKATAASQGQFIPDSQRAGIERQVMERLLNVQLLTKLAADEDRSKAREASEKTFLEYRNRASSEENFSRKLVAMGMSVDAFKAKLYEETLCSQVIDRLIRSPLKIPDEAVQQYYETNTVQFSLPEKVRVSHILFLTQDMSSRSELSATQREEKRKLAGKILARIKAGEDFAKLAREYSEDPNSREKGGELPPMSRRQLAPDFEQAAFALSVSQVSDPVKTEAGYHLIKLHEIIPAKTNTLAEVGKDIRELLSRLEAQKKLPEFLKRLRDDAGVEYLDK